jgi:colanic acid/amylovoran biosynthesis protein
MPETKDKALLKVLSKAYDPETMRGIIASLDFLVSGRLHAAISGLSQCVPTVIVDYGFPPKGHKLLGIAKLMGVEDLFCDPNDKEKLLAVIAGAWQERAAIRRRIEKNLVGVKKQAELNFSILKDLSEKSVK